MSRYGIRSFVDSRSSGIVNKKLKFFIRLNELIWINLDCDKFCQFAWREKYVSRW